MSTYFCACLHLGHRNISKFRGCVTSTQNNTDIILDSWRKTIGKRDLVFVLGDVAFDLESLNLLKDLRGRKILVKGNHDDQTSTLEQMEVFEEIHGIIKYKNFWLSHCPIHPDEIRGQCGNVHGHVHSKSIMKKTWYGKKISDKRYLNSCVDIVYPATGSIFTSLDQAKAYFGS